MSRLRRTFSSRHTFQHREHKSILLKFNSELVFGNQIPLIFGDENTKCIDLKCTKCNKYTIPMSNTSSTPTKACTKYIFHKGICVANLRSFSCLQIMRCRSKLGNHEVCVIENPQFHSTNSGLRHSRQRKVVSIPCLFCPAAL